MTVTTINVKDMHCASCSNKIRSALEGFKGIEQLQFNPVRRQVFVTHAEDLSQAKLLAQIEQAGFQPLLEADSRQVWQGSADLLKRLGVAGLAMMQVMMVQVALYAGVFQGMEESMRRLLEYTALLFSIPVVVYSATPFFKNALAGIRHGLNMDAPIALAVTLAFCVSFIHTVKGSGEVYYDSVVMFTFLMLGARYLEQRLRHRLGVEDSLQASMPRFATAVVEGKQREVEVAIAEGHQIPVDGVLNSAQAIVEEALLTGESDWHHRQIGEPIFAGTFNRGPGFYLDVTAPLEQSRVAHIDRLANTALDAKHQLARVADKVAQVFVPTILLIAATTYAIWSSIAPQFALSAALAVLVVSCPCALSLATPAALTAALTRLRQAGVLVKNSRALEVAQQIRHVYFDKTGTLTYPQARIDSVQPLGRISQAHCLQYASALQAHSTHPLAMAFKDASVDPAQDVKLVTGQGVEGKIDGHVVRIGQAKFCNMAEQDSDQKLVYLSVDGQAAAIFAIANEIRQDAEQTIALLREYGLNVSMLSGDNDANCIKTAEKLGPDYVANSRPETKPDVIRDNRGSAMYVGDGVNDLPALASADVSVATMETSDLVKSKADVLLLTQRLGALIDFIRIGRRSRHIMVQNLLWALAYNLLAIPLAAMGYAPPWAAALGMSISSLIVMLNASRVLNTPLQRG